MSDASSFTHTIPVGGLEPCLFLPRIRVEVLEGPDQGKSVLVDKGRLSVGTGSQNDLVLTDPTASQEHLVVERSAGENPLAHLMGRTTATGRPGIYTLRDLHSTNGTWVSGARIKEVYLSPDLDAKAGSTRLRFHTEEETLPVPPSTASELEGLLGSTPEMRRLFGMIERVSQTESAVLLLGETGTGKEGLARAIHALSPRKHEPFVVIDCAALAPNLVESELFGFKKGAFTGAERDRRGLFEEAHGGTVFLDEIGDFPKSQQPLLLRALESRSIRPVGENRYKKIDVRVVAATHRNLREEIEKDAFRADLYYRLATIEIEVPPLRERIDDLGLLLEGFLGEFRDAHPGLPVHGASPEAMELLRSYRWPGNVRELRNAILGAASKRQQGMIQALDLPSWLRQPSSPGPSAPTHLPSSHEQELPPYSEEKQRILDHFEQSYFSRLLERHDHNISQAARAANVTRKVIHNAIKKHQLKKS